MFSRTGIRLPSAPPWPTVAEAVAATGVDLAALVDFATRRPPFAGGVTGDPHVITGAGARISTQATGQFQARASDPAHRVQLRTEAMPYQGDVSYVTAAAIGVPGHRIQFGLDGTLSVDGGQLTGGTGFRQIDLADGPDIGWWPANAAGDVAVVVLWADGASVAMSANAALGLTVTARMRLAAAAGWFSPSGAGSPQVELAGSRVPVTDSLFADELPPASAPVGPAAVVTAGPHPIAPRIMSRRSMGCSTTPHYRMNSDGAAASGRASIRGGGRPTSWPGSFPQFCNSDSFESRSFPGHGFAIVKAKFMKVVVVHRGARDGYQTALAMAEAGQLERLVTDLYWSEGSGLARYARRMLGSRASRLLGARGNSPVDPRLVEVCPASGLVSFATDKIRQTPFSWRARATRWTDETLGRRAGAIAGQTGAALLSYSYYGQSAFAAAAAGTPKLLFQLHPHPASMRRILRRELAEHPECAASLEKEWELALSDDDFARMCAEPAMASEWIAASSFTSRNAHRTRR